MNVILAHDVREKKSESVSHSVVCDFFDPMDCSLPGSSIHGIPQARVLEWVAILSFKGSSWPRDQTQVSCIVGRLLTFWATREEKEVINGWSLSTIPYLKFE